MGMLRATCKDDYEPKLRFVNARQIIMKPTKEKKTVRHPVKYNHYNQPTHYALMPVHNPARYLPGGTSYIHPPVPLTSRPPYTSW